MTSIRPYHTLALALAATLAVAGCKKEEAAPPPMSTPAPAPAPTAPPAAAIVNVEDVMVGIAGTAGNVDSPAREFAPIDSITASVTTTTSDPNATVPGMLAAKWLFEDGQVVNDESKSVEFAGMGVTSFQISKPDGWPTGNYKVEVSLDGNRVKTQEFTVR